MSLSKPQQPAKTVTLPKLNQTPDIRRVFRSWRDVFLAQVNGDKDIRDLLSCAARQEAPSHGRRARETSDRTIARTMQPRDSDLIPREKIRVRAYLRHVESNKNGKQRLYACLMSCLDSPLRLFIKNCNDGTGSKDGLLALRRLEAVYLEFSKRHVLQLCSEVFQTRQDSQNVVMYISTVDRRLAEVEEHIGGENNPAVKKYLHLVHRAIEASAYKAAERLVDAKGTVGGATFEVADVKKVGPYVLHIGKVTTGALALALLMSTRDSDARERSHEHGLQPCKPTPLRQWLRESSPRPSEWILRGRRLQSPLHI